MKITATIFAALILSGLGQAATINVPAEQPTIQAGVDVAISGDTVLVAPGTYTGDDNRDIDCGGKALVLRSASGPELTILKPGGVHFDLHRALVFQSGEDSTTRVEGFTVRNGFWDLETSGGPAAWFSSSSPTIENCIFENNDSHFGGAIRCDRASPTFINCTFESNTAHEGGAIYCRDSSFASFTGCTWRNNQAYDGAGLYCNYYSDIVLHECLFIENHAENTGGALRTRWWAYPSVVGCTFVRNSTDNQGSSVHGPVGILDRCLIVFGLGHDPASVGPSVINCCNIFGNEYGDWTGTIGSQLGMNGNVSLDPRFCGDLLDDFRLDAGSPCAPANNECGVQIGSFGVGCSKDYGRTWRVRADGTGDAPTVQAAVDSALSGDTVVLAAGTYRGEGNNNVNPLWKYLVLRSESGPSQTIIDCEGTEEDPHRGIALRYRQGRDFIIEGFAFRNGVAPWDGPFQERPSHEHPDGNYNESVGGAIALFSSSPTILNCVFEDNWAFNPGGAIYCQDTANAIIQDCEFYNNYGRSGGGVYTWLSSVEVSNCHFKGNWCTDYGGGLFANMASVPIITDCVFDSNLVGTVGGCGIALKSGADAIVSGCRIINNRDMVGYCQGGGVWIQGASPHISDCDIRNNVANNPGGGLYIGWSQAIIEDCIIAGNVVTYGERRGAGMYITHASPIFRHCTIYDHHAYYGAHVCMVGTALIDARFENCIFAHSSGGPPFYPPEYTHPPTLECCNMYDNSGGDWIGFLEGQFGIDGNISEPSLFCDTAVGDLRLQATSPCAPANNTCGELIGALGVGCGGTDVDEDDSHDGLPMEFAVSQNYPNPFNPATTISYALPVASHVDLALYNLLGQRITTLVDKIQPPGKHTIIWNGRDSHGEEVSTGIYFYRITAGDFTQTRKMMLVR